MISEEAFRRHEILKSGQDQGAAESLQRVVDLIKRKAALNVELDAVTTELDTHSPEEVERGEGLAERIPLE